MTYDLGIDVGTTFTAAAVHRDGVVETLALESDAVAVPSVIFAGDDQLLYGDHALRRGRAEPAGLAQEFKRRLGDPVPLILSGTAFRADRLTALMAAWVVDVATRQLGGPPRQVVSTHPANWTLHQLEILQQALAEAGLADTVLLPEPNAAALDFAAHARVDDGSLVLVYDLGGGTFDVSLLRRAGAVFQHEIESFGIERLGGIDFDEAIFRRVLASLPQQVLTASRSSPQHHVAIAQLRRMCVDAKEHLSSSPVADVPVTLPGHSATVRITRAEFEQMIRPMIDQTVDGVRRTMAGAGLGAADLGAVLLVGGSSRIPLVAEVVADQLGAPVRVDAHPKLVTSRGAARHVVDGPPRARARPVVAPRRGGRRRPVVVGAAVIVVAGLLAGGWALTLDGSSSGGPTSFATVDEIATDPAPLAVEVVDTDLWVASSATGTVERFVPGDRSATRIDAVELPLARAGANQGNDIVAVGDSVYVTQYDARSVGRITVAEGLVDDVERIGLEGSPSDATVLGPTVWVCVDTSATASALVPIDGASAGTAVPTEAIARSVTPHAGRLWVALIEEDRVAAVDPGTGSIETLEVGRGPTDLLVVDDEIWVALTGADEIAVVDPGTMSVVERIDAGTAPRELLGAFGSVWVLNRSDGASVGSVSRFHPDTKRRLQPPIGVGRGPEDLTADGDRLYVANLAGSEAVGDARGSVTVIAPDG